MLLLLREKLSNKKWKEFKAAVAFAKKSGIDLLWKDLNDFAQRGKVILILGVDQNITTREALDKLLKIKSERFKVYIS